MARPTLAHRPTGSVPTLGRTALPSTLGARASSPPDWSPGAPLQRALLERLIEAGGEAIDTTSLAGVSARWRTSMRSLLERGLVVREETRRIPENRASGTAPELFEEQRHAVEAIVAALGRFRPFLLDGVTGSGKTEVYLQAIRAARERDLQVLVLVPEISLTPQLMRRFEARLDGCLVTLHSGLNDTERLQNWLLAAEGHADVIIGTRSAVLVPLPRLGAGGRGRGARRFAQAAGRVPLPRAGSGADASAPPRLPGGARHGHAPRSRRCTTSPRGRYASLPLARRAGEAEPPTLALLDIRRRALIEGMSDRLLEAIARHLAEGGPGDGVRQPPRLRPDAPVQRLRRGGRLRAVRRAHDRARTPEPPPLPPLRSRAHPCRGSASAAVRSGSIGVGHGTERISDAPRGRPSPTCASPASIATAHVARERSSGQLDLATSGEARLLVGTQMLAKGHHFPKLTLVGILDADRGLCSAPTSARSSTWGS